MTEEYKEDERKRKQKGIERKARRAVSGANMTKSQKMEVDRQKRMKEIVRKNKMEGNDYNGVRLSKRESLINNIFDILDEDAGKDGIR